MKTLNLLNYAQDGWYGASGGLAEVRSAVTGDLVATTGSRGIDFKAMLDHARKSAGRLCGASPSTSARIC
jgi:oxepin-CoA hydrolase/3-oxo-5,6-dehydrosuberyl-CoA semialdehyde dehydrogenase